MLCTYSFSSRGESSGGCGENVVGSVACASSVLLFYAFQPVMIGVVEHFVYHFQASSESQLQLTVHF